MVEDLLTWLGAQDPATLFWLAVVLVVLGYLFSLWAHPWAKCGLCKARPATSAPSTPTRGARAGVAVAPAASTALVCG